MPLCNHQMSLEVPGPCLSFVGPQREKSSTLLRIGGGSSDSILGFPLTPSGREGPGCLMTAPHVTSSDSLQKVASYSWAVVRVLSLSGVL